MGAETARLGGGAKTRFGDARQNDDDGFESTVATRGGSGTDDAPSGGGEGDGEREVDDGEREVDDDDPKSSESPRVVVASGRGTSNPTPGSAEALEAVQ